MVQYAAARYFPMPARVLGRNENGDNGFGSYAWSPDGRNKVPASLLGEARYGDIRVTVRKELVTLFTLMFEITDLMGYKIYTKNPNGSGEPWGPWSYENRPIGGTQSPSNHSRGRAIDCNAPYNPQSRTFVSTWPPEVIDKWEQCGFRWGGRYKSPTKYDTMHLNYAGNMDEIESDVVRARQFRDRLRGGAPTLPAPTPVPAGDLEGGTNDWPIPAGHYFGPGQSGYSHNGTGSKLSRDFVAEFQDQLNKLGYAAGAPDGIFGEKTQKAALAWQTRVVATVGAGPRNIQTSALCGPNDWYAIHETLYQVRPAPVVNYAPPFPGTLRRGMTGEAVRTMQTRLNEHLKNGYGKQIGMDGDFGPATEKALKWYQSMRLDAPYNLRQYGGADGVCGRQTWMTLWK